MKKFAKYIITIILCIILYFVIFGGLSMLMDRPIRSPLILLGYAVLCVFLWKKINKGEE